MRVVDVLVVGGGQAGLSAAFHLTRTGTDYVVLDAESAPGGAWQHRWPTLTMATVNGIRELPEYPVPSVDPNSSASQVIPEYFADYETVFDLRIRRPVAVRSIHSTSSLLIAHTSAGDFAARALINATGTWTRPFWPAVNGREVFAGHQLHTHDYPGPQPFAGHRVIVVGGGISALQSLLEIGPLAAATLWVTRREPEFVEREFSVELGREAVALVAERVAAGLPPASVVSVTGLGLTSAVRAGQAAGYLRRRPMFSRLIQSGAVWDRPGDPSARRRAAGQPVRRDRADEFGADTILWATGFRAALDHLAPLHLRNPGGGITMDGTRVVKEPRVHLVGYGPSASTVGANRAGRLAVREIRRLLDLGHQ